MAIPALDKHGLLPVGCHDCTWEEIRESFCWNAHRTELYNRAQDFLAQVWSPLKIAAPIWVDGSFTRQKDHPADIDVVADVSHLDQPTATPAIMLWINRVAVKHAYSVDFWIKHPFLPTDLTEFFRYAGTKAAAETGLDSKYLKGILRVLP